MIEKLKKNPFVSILIICSIVISMTVGVTYWFYQRNLEYVISKCEADKANMRKSYEDKIRTKDFEIKQLTSKKDKTKGSSPPEVKQETKGTQSPAVISEEGVTIEYGKE